MGVFLHTAGQLPLALLRPSKVGVALRSLYPTRSLLPIYRTWRSCGEQGKARGHLNTLERQAWSRPHVPDFSLVLQRTAGRRAGQLSLGRHPQVDYRILGLP
jgi:hypothetical protein